MLRTARLIGVASCLLAGTPGTLRAGAPDTIVARLVALPLSDRASLLVELKSPVPLARETKSDAQSVVVEAGPIDGPVQAVDLTPAETTPLLGTVSVASVTAPNGQAFLRITVQLRARASHRVRLAGSRIYVDLAPLPPRPVPAELNAGAERPSTPTTAAVPAPVAPAQGTSAAATAGAPATPATSPPPSGGPTGGAPSTGAMTDEALDTAYRTLQADVSKRAAALVPKADVKGLLALIDEAKQHDERLGKRRPELAGKIFEELNRKLDEARLRRLEMDARSFERQGQRAGEPR